jgi:hypothetical protein
MLGKLKNLLSTGVQPQAEGRREPNHHGVLPCLVGGEGWSGDNLYCDGRAVPPALTDCTACPGRGLLSCEFLAIPAAIGISKQCTQNTHINEITHGAGFTSTDKRFLGLTKTRMDRTWGQNQYCICTLLPKSPKEV